MKTLLTCSILLITGLFYGQDETSMIQWLGKVSNAKTSGKLDGVQIKITKNGKQVSSFTNTKPGKFKTEEFEAGYVYVIEFSKAKFVPKSLKVDVDNGYFAEDMEELTQLEVDIRLTPVNINCDYKSLDIMAGRARISPETGQVDWDLGFATKCKRKFDDFQSRMDKSLALLNESRGLYKEGEFDSSMSALVKIDEALISANVLNKFRKEVEVGIENGPKAQYRKLIAKADGYFSDEELDQSENLYKRANGINPGDEHAKARLKIIDEKRKILLVSTLKKVEDRITEEPIVSEIVQREEKETIVAVAAPVNAERVANQVVERRVYIGDDLLAQNEKFRAYQQKLSSRTRSYTSSDDNSNYRVRAYRPDYTVNKPGERSYNGNTYLEDLHNRGRIAQENRSNTD